ncbi:MAG: hypothetical protein ACRYF2_22200 [Janthinobacterium lividum]
MTDLSELEAAAEAVNTAAVKDRRRPGRLDDVNAELIPILRGAEPPVEFELDDIDQTAALRGLVAGVLFSAPIWVAIAYLGSWLISK